MNLREAATTIKQSVSMQEVAEFYGFLPNRAGYIHCPFHAGDNQGSLKVYDGQGGFCCFGCGAKGSVIDFVMKLYDISFTAACERLSTDFSLNLPIGRKLTHRERERRKGAIMTAREQVSKHEAEQARINQKCTAAFDLWCLADLVKIRYGPENTGGRILPGYANAVRELPLLADNLTQAEIERWKFEHPEQSGNGPSGSAELDKGKLPDAGTV
jgi:hypothetical protein